jgi:hypothetical protein
MPDKSAPFEFDALRPFVSVTLHEIAQQATRGQKKGGTQQANERIASELEGSFDSLFDAFDIAVKNPYKISGRPDDRGIIKTRNENDLSLVGVWFKQIKAPPWLDAKEGPAKIRDTTNHILLLAIRCPYLAVLGTHERTRMLLSDGLERGDCGRKQLSFRAPVINQETLERAFVRGQTRAFWLSGLHTSVETKPDSKMLIGRDLRKALDPFSDQTFTYTSAISILPPQTLKRRPRNRYGESATSEQYTHDAFRVGARPEQRRVWTVPTKDFNHLLEELRVLFDTLSISYTSEIGEWGPHQEGFSILRKPIPITTLVGVENAFDVGLDLPLPVEPGNDVGVSSEPQRCRELWRAYGQLEVISTDNGPNRANFTARASFDGQPIMEFSVEPRNQADGSIAIHRSRVKYLVPETEHGITCFETIVEGHSGEVFTIHYDSGHVIRGCRLFDLGWQEVLFESWKWCFRSQHAAHIYCASKEKPIITGVSKRTKVPKRDTVLGWELTLGTDIGNPASLFEYVVVNAKELFRPNPDHEWHLCCDDGAGEVADFVYFEPRAGRLFLIHIKGAGNDNPTRGISVKAYEEVVSQAVKNLRYLDVHNLASLLDAGKQRPIGQTCFYRTTSGAPTGRSEILNDLQNFKGRLSDKRVVVFQPHVLKSAWKSAHESWLRDEKATPQNQINRFLQLRTLLADAEITCKKIGARFEVWSEDDTAA